MIHGGGVGNGRAEAELNAVSADWRFCSEVTFCRRPSRASMSDWRGFVGTEVPIVAAATFECLLGEVRCSASIPRKQSLFYGSVMTYQVGGGAWDGFASVSS